MGVKHCLWGQDVFVDVETGVNTAISKIRQGRRDGARARVPVRGAGRGIARASDGGTPASPLVAPTPAERPPPTHVAARPTPRVATYRGLVTVVALVAIVAGVFVWTRPSGASRGRVALAVLPVDNVGNDPAREYLATGLTQETSASLAQIGRSDDGVVDRMLRVTYVDA